TLHRMGRGLIIGEPGGGTSARVRTLGELFTRAGFEVTCSQRIRYDVWYKLWGNMTMNPVSALTGATMDRVLDDELVRAFCSRACSHGCAGCIRRPEGPAEGATRRQPGSTRARFVRADGGAAGPQVPRGPEPGGREQQQRPAQRLRSGAEGRREPIAQPADDL